jgi:tRNA wybutosine-synthesizing protein 2
LGFGYPNRALWHTFFIEGGLLPEHVSLMQNTKGSSSRITPFQNIKKSIVIPPHLRVFLPRKWELLGDVLLMKIPDELEGMKGEIAREYAKELGAKTVLQDLGIMGELRKPNVGVLWGSETETVHKENGVKFKMDCAELMFSSGNVDERIRMAAVSNPQEVVVDMFAGIGFFSIPMAVHSRPRKIFALELNPVAHKYLSENVQMNDVENIVEPVLGDNREFDRIGIADRIVMGYLDDTYLFLPKALEILKQDGGVIHYHEKCPNELLDKRPLDNVKKAVDEKGRDMGILKSKIIKSYAPGVSHIVLDVLVN